MKVQEILQKYKQMYIGQPLCMHLILFRYDFALTLEKNSCKYLLIFFFALRNVNVFAIMSRRHFGVRGLSRLDICQ